MDWGYVFEFATTQALGPTAVVYALAAIGLNIHFGYTGLLNFGQAGFMAVGAYGTATSVATFGLPLWGGLLVGLLATVVLALVLGVPTLRLRADYLAIATIASAEILRRIFQSVTFSDTFGGSTGLSGFARDFYAVNPYTGTLDLGFISFRNTTAWVLTVGWGLVLLSCLIVWAATKSPWGRVLKSIREDEDAVRSLGKNVYWYKMQALILGGLFGGLAGIVLILSQSAAVPTDFATNTTFFAWACLLLGGAARVWGPVIGAIIFWFLLNFLGELFSQMTRGADPILPTWLMTETQASLIRFIILGLGLMLLMIFRPQGIFGDRRELAIDAR
ncbi:branched-chain amino acid ABC transporter permease [Aeromicrobium sp. YIM 150415]|uniref:branched-chain amino acid ABC transporter permease n=1 Tax=Aeromicrobium sp. YIM 150415 TaxID=2803912 RepID=UPI00196355D7|nr:branched-chain amino acid ABC transporter permease [Aeromicrobium sp. YIM 150415]MBM9462687.1 branched-chain amino acid ABC transporter permease [Aeromicrobium sp. YIM 150415]